eukprot:CAMPEP_0117747492 /NCGR_PEP_ID=MMETSP0947-20121206/8536_1 /TAXON_ID=44440 /ORGANISM="Chattonella subsalsa, Strain CCMP2191" /LENGTH=116 /DNA_ID=CAMNT_0005564941 /DNA_START=167 /DNA_END=517 /DNA_ORIENTATION=+
MEEKFYLEYYGVSGIYGGKENATGLEEYWVHQKLGTPRFGSAHPSCNHAAIGFGFDHRAASGILGFDPSPLHLGAQLQQFDAKDLVGCHFLPHDVIVAGFASEKLHGAFFVDAAQR